MPPSTAESPRSSISLGVTLGFVVFAAVSLLTGIISVAHAGTYYDFRAFYAAGYLVLHHPSQLFDLHAQALVQERLISQIHATLPYYHPAFEALLYAPLALFSYRTAYVLYFALNLLLLVTCYRIAPEPAVLPNGRSLRPWLFLLSFPAFYCVVTGQDSLLFLLLLCLLWRALDRGNDLLAGVLLALCAFKMHLLAPLLVLLLVRRGARLLLTFIPAVTGLGVLTVAIVGLKGTKQWIHLLTSAATALNQDKQAQLSSAVWPKAMPTLKGLIYICGGRFLPPVPSLILDMVLLALTFAATLLIVRQSRRLSSAFCAALAAMLLLSPHLYVYDYVLLLPGLLLLTGWLRKIAAAIYCILPFILFGIHGLNWLAPLAVLPLTILAVLFVTERSHVPQSEPEKVTPQLLTAVD